MRCCTCSFPQWNIKKQVNNASLTWVACSGANAASASPCLSSPARLAAAAFSASLSRRALSGPSPTPPSAASFPSRALARAPSPAPSVAAPVPGGPAPAPCPGSVPEGPARAPAPLGQSIKLFDWLKTYLFIWNVCGKKKHYHAWMHR